MLWFYAAHLTLKKKIQKNNNVEDILPYSQIDCWL